MGTITGTAIMNEAATILFDNNNVKWGRLELLGWLNDAQRALITLLPEAASQVEVVQLAAGTRQTIPTTGWLLLTVTRNMGTNGSTPGRAPQKIDRAVFDQTNPNWYDAAATSAIAMFMYDDRDRTAFYNYPPADGTGYVEILMSLTPVDLAVEANTIVVMDLYKAALLDYVLFRCHSKGGGLGDPNQAKAYYESFTGYVAAQGGGISRLAGAPE